MDEELPGNEMKRMEEHLQACARCQELYADLKGTVGLVRALSRVPIPKGFAKQVRERIEQGSAKEPEPAGQGVLLWKRFLIRRWTPLAAAAAVVLIVGGALFLRSYPPPREAREVAKSSPAEREKGGRFEAAGPSGRESKGEEPELLEALKRAKEDTRKAGKEAWQKNALGRAGEDYPSSRGRPRGKGEPSVEKMGKGGGLEEEKAQKKGLREERPRGHGAQERREAYKEKVPGAKGEELEKVVQGKEISEGVGEYNFLFITSSSPGRTDFEQVLRVLRNHKVEPLFEEKNGLGAQDILNGEDFTLQKWTAFFVGKELPGSIAMTVDLTPEQHQSIGREFKILDMENPNMVVHFSMQEQGKKEREAADSRPSDKVLPPEIDRARKALAKDAAEKETPGGLKTRTQDEEGDKKKESEKKIRQEKAFEGAVPPSRGGGGKKGTIKVTIFFKKTKEQK